MKEKLIKSRGITLVALVITVIILLILAGISISSLTGSGLFKKAEDAKYNTKRMEIIEKARMDILEKQTENLGKFKENELVEILKKYGDISSTEESILDETLTTKDKKYEIKVSEIWDKPFASSKISFTLKEEKFEVEEGTTWEKFFCEIYLGGDFEDWLYEITTGQVLYLYEISSTGTHAKLNKLVKVDDLVGGHQIAVIKDDLIQNGYYEMGDEVISTNGDEVSMFKKK